MNDQAAFGTFFLPGPTEVRAEVLAAMARPMIPHRGAEFEAMFARIQDGLRHVFRTSRPVYVSSSSASGLMEAAVRCAAPGPVLSLVNGAFSARFAQIASACDRSVDVLEAPPGRVHDLDAVDDALARRSYVAMTAVHSETSTGALADLRALTEVAHRRGAMILVDSVTGIAGAPVETDAWELDFVLTGSQKALALPPGLAFGVASESYLKQAREATARGRYFDLIEIEEFARKNQTPATPAISLLYAADVQLGAIRAEGIEARWARHVAMRDVVAAWTRDRQADGIPVAIVAPEGFRSPTVSALRLPDGVRGDDIVKGVARHGFVVGNGYGALRESTFRIGHMGDHTPDGVASCLDACLTALTGGPRPSASSR
jgi:aspartate aminotransferase-like enzyme